ncbi:MAG: radical SAM family heme chaperone HemW [Actinomycetota bacterium]|nr:radical SAM family heme chaperone HemW [Actinomycetota bacterium]
MRTEVPAGDVLLADAAAAWVGAYVHIPFCRRVCPYCDFAVVEGQDDLRSPYLAALIAEIQREPRFTRPLDAVFVGGGTPTAVDPVDLGRVIAALDDRLGLAPDAEISLEANPEDLTPRVAAALADQGFNRISLGVQSFDPVVLQALGRRHDPDMAAEAIVAALSAFPSVNVDLIFGTPGEAVSSWRDSVERALGAGVHHLSAYALTVERGTPLGRAVQAGAPAPDPDDQAAKYDIVVKAAAAAGLDRYETSNFAMPGHHCRHNLLTWAQGEYAAFGNGAHRHRAGTRSWNVRRLDRYVERAADSAVSGDETLDPWGREVERVALGLRRAAGVVAGRAGGALLESPEGRRLLDAGVIGAVGDRIVVTRPLLGDEVARTLLALQPGDC